MQMFYSCGSQHWRGGLLRGSFESTALALALDHTPTRSLLWSLLFLHTVSHFPLAGTALHASGQPPFPPSSAQTVFSTSFPLFSFSQTPPTFSLPISSITSPTRVNSNEVNNSVQVATYNSLCLIDKQDTITTHLAQGHLNPTHPSTVISHEHITNEQIHDSKSSRHTLNPTGARERARRADDFNYRSVRVDTNSASRCNCRPASSIQLFPAESLPKVQARDNQSRCPAQVWQSRHHRWHQHRPRERPQSPQRENTNASFAIGRLAGASTVAVTSDHVRYISLPDVRCNHFPSRSRPLTTRSFPLCLSCLHQASHLAVRVLHHLLPFTSNFNIPLTRPSQIPKSGRSSA